MIHIRLLVPVTTKAARTPEDLTALSQPGVRYSAAIIEAGPPSIESRVDEAFAVPSLVEIARQAEADRVDAVVIDCMGDPGLAALREAVSIPVIGAAQGAMAMASSMAHSFGIVSVLARTEAKFRELVAVYGHERQYVGARTISMPVLDVISHKDEIKEQLAEKALLLVRDSGAGAIILGCTGFFGCAEFMRSRLHEQGYAVPVIDPLPLATLVAAVAVRHGVSHSKISYPPDGLLKPFKGYSLALNSPVGENAPGSHG